MSGSRLCGRGKKVAKGFLSLSKRPSFGVNSKTGKTEETKITQKQGKKSFSTSVQEKINHQEFLLTKPIKTEV